MADSGANRSVRPKAHAVHVKTDGRAENVELVSASGSVTPKHGSECVSFELADGQQIRVRHTAADVKRPALSASAEADQGTSWIFCPSGSFTVKGDFELD